MFILPGSRDLLHPSTLLICYKGGGTTYVPPEKKIMAEPAWEKQEREQLTNTYFGNNGLFTGALDKTNQVYDQFGNLGTQYGNLGNTYGSQFQDLANGLLPTQFADNFEQGISRGVNNTVGNTINGLANRGVLNSSVTTKALGDITDSVSSAAAQNYNQSMNTVGNMLGRGYDAQSGALAGQAGLLGQQNSMNSDNITNALNLYNSAANRRYGLQGDTIVKQDNGAMGAVGSIGSALIMCFAADTLICTPDGQVPIQDIVVGMKVLSLDANDDVCVETVDHVETPRMCDVVELVTDKGSVKTTVTQRFITDSGTLYVEEIGNSLILTKDDFAEVKGVKNLPAELVYDFTVSGRNIFFANGLAAEGWD